MVHDVAHTLSASAVSDVTSQIANEPVDRRVGRILAKLLCQLVIQLFFSQLLELKVKLLEAFDGILEDRPRERCQQLVFRECLGYYSVIDTLFPSICYLVGILSMTDCIKNLV